MSRKIDPRLSTEMNLLGHVWGHCIRSQKGAPALAKVEKARVLSKQDRKGQSMAGKKLQRLLHGSSDADLELLSKSFCEFMRIANTAEQVHRIRALEENRVREDDRLRGVIKNLRAKVGNAAIKRTLSELEIDLVLTAHPTEAMPPLTRRACRQIAEGLHHEEAQLLAQGVETLWASEAVRPEKPTPLDEALSTFAIVEDSLWESLPKAARLCEEVLGEKLGPDWSPFRFSSWLGGDRDGNPFVTAQMTREIRREARRMALRLFAGDLQNLTRDLQFPDLPIENLEKWIRLLRQEERALEKDGRHPKPAREEELRRELLRFHAELEKRGLHALAAGAVSDLLRKLRAFGLGLFRIDIRQSSDIHEKLINDLTSRPGFTYSSLSEKEKIRFLKKAPRPSRNAKLDAQGRDLRDLFHDLARERAEGVNCYIISMTEAASDLLEVRWLQKAFKMEPLLPIVPLFETPDALEAATRIMTEFWRETPVPRSRDQQIMLGYSDSTKRGGLLASAWTLHHVQRDLEKTARRFGRSLVFFHGRGGSIGRGGGPVREALRSLPIGTRLHRIRITEQGESIESKFGLPEIAIRSLELYVIAVMEARLLKTSPDRPKWAELMTDIAVESQKSFQEFIYEDPEFMDFFQAVTPVEELGVLKIGSRPSRRKKKKADLDSLRAIPWIFSWTQNRALLASWLGAGEALETAWRKGKGPLLQQMDREWMFFQSMLDLLEMVLAKADLKTFGLYREHLLPAKFQGKAQEVEARLRKTSQMVRRIMGEKRLLENQPSLRESIEIRTRYVDVLNRLQVEILRRRRAGRRSGALEKALAMTISGIAAGMRNTG